MATRTLGSHWPLLVVPPGPHLQETTEQRLERALAAAGAIAWEWDVESGECRLSAGSCKLLSLKDHPGDGLFNLVHADDRGWLKPAIIEAARGLRPYDFEFRLVGPDGAVEWVRDRGQLVLDSSGQPSRLSGVAQIITAERRARDAFIATFEQAPVGMAQVAPDLSILKANASLCRMFGRPYQDVLLCRFIDLMLEEDVDAFRGQVLDLLGGRVETFTTEKRFLRRDDAVVWANLTASLVRDAIGNSDYIVLVAEDISQRKSLEAEARADLLLKGLMEVSQDCVKLLDHTGHLLSVNAAGRKVLGITDFEVCRGRPWQSFLPKESAGLVEEALAAAQAGRSKRFTSFRVLPNGEIRFLDSEVWPLPDGDGRLVAVSREITELRNAWLAVDGVKEDTPYTGVERRRRGEKRATERDARLSASVASSPDATVSFDAKDGRIRSWNNAAGELFGYTEEEAVGSPVDLLLPPELAVSDSTTMFSRVMEGERIQEFESVCLTKDGTRIDVAITAARMYTPDGGILGVSTIFRDIGARKLAERALSESAARFRSLIDNIPQKAFVLLPDGSVDFANQRLQDYIGIGFDARGRWKWTDFIHPDELAYNVGEWQAALRVGREYQTECRLLSSSGTYCWFLTRVVPLRDDTGLVTRWYGTSTDISAIVVAREITARQRIELEHLVAERTQTLQDAANALSVEMRRREDTQSALLHAQKLEALGQLVGGVAHDFNNVLTAISGSYNLLRRRTDSEKMLELIDLGEAAAQRSTGLVKQLLALSRKNELRLVVTEFVPLLRDFEILARHAVDSRVGIHVEVLPNTWPVMVDVLHLETALLNLVVNARDAMENSGAVKITARNLLGIERPAELPIRDYVSVTVTDTGRGMPQDVADRATDPYFTTKPNGKGTGLGLAMVRDFAMQSNGLLRIKSQLGHGTTIEIVLPRAEMIEDRERDGGAAPAENMSLHGNASILVVDDDAQVRRTIGMLLRDVGYDVMEADNSEVARVLLHTLVRIDLLLTDIDMPGRDGFELASMLRAEQPGLPVLFMTGDPRRTVSGDETILRKPFAENDLRAAVLRRLGRLPSLSRATTFGDTKLY